MFLVEEKVVAYMKVGDEVKIEKDESLLLNDCSTDLEEDCLKCISLRTI